MFSFFHLKHLTLISFLPSLFSGKDLQDFYEQNPIIIRELVYRLNDDNTEVLKANHKAFAALSKHVPAEELVEHIEFMRNLISSMVSDSRRRKGGVGDGEFLLPGFNIPKGKAALKCIFAICKMMTSLFLIPTYNMGCQRLVFLIANLARQYLLFRISFPHNFF